MHGEPIRFGKDKEKGISLNRGSLELEIIAALGNEDKLLIHDEKNKIQAQLLAAMEGPDFPVAVGILYQQEKPAYISDAQSRLRKARNKDSSIEALLNSGATWEVK